MDHTHEDASVRPDGPTWHTAAHTATLARMFKAVVCFALFFIVVGAAGMFLAEQRRKRGGPH